MAEEDTEGQYTENRQPVPLPPGVGAINTTPAEATASYGTRADEEAEASEAAVHLVIALPSGTEEKASFPPGQLVGYVKAFLARKHELLLAKLQLHVCVEGDERKLMLDPLSLVDCPNCTPGATVRIAATLS